jgi:hypothetical protein
VPEQEAHVIPRQCTFPILPHPGGPAQVGQGPVGQPGQKRAGIYAASFAQWPAPRGQRPHRPEEPLLRLRPGRRPQMLPREGGQRRVDRVEVERLLHPRPQRDLLSFQQPPVPEAVEGPRRLPEQRLLFPLRCLRYPFRPEENRDGQLVYKRPGEDGQAGQRLRQRGLPLRQRPQGEAETGPQGVVAAALVPPLRRLRQHRLQGLHELPQGARLLVKPAGQEFQRQGVAAHPPDQRPHPLLRQRALPGGDPLPENLRPGPLVQPGDLHPHLPRQARPLPAGDQEHHAPRGEPGEEPVEGPRVGVPGVPGPGEGLKVVQRQQDPLAGQRVGHPLLPPLRVQPRVLRQPQEPLHPPQDGRPGGERVQGDGQDAVKGPGEPLRGPAQQRRFADAAGPVQGDNGGTPLRSVPGHQPFADLHQFPVAAEEAALRHGQAAQVHPGRGLHHPQPPPLRQGELREPGALDVEDGDAEGQAARLHRERGVVEDGHTALPDRLQDGLAPEEVAVETGHELPGADVGHGELHPQDEGDALGTEERGQVGLGVLSGGRAEAGGEDGQGDPAPQEVRHPARLHGVGGARGLLKEQRGGPAVPIAVAGEVEDAAPHPGQRFPQSVRRRRDHPDQFQGRVGLLQDAPNLRPLLRHGEGIGSRLAAGREQRVGGDEEEFPAVPHPLPRPFGPPPPPLPFHGRGGGGLGGGGEGPRHPVAGRQPVVAVAEVLPGDGVQVRRTRRGGRNPQEQDPVGGQGERVQLPAGRRPLREERGEEPRAVNRRVIQERPRLLRGQPDVGQGERVAGSPVGFHRHPVAVHVKAQGQHGLSPLFYVSRFTFHGPCET